MNHYDVLIATPGNKLESQYVKSLTETLAECHKRGISYLWLNASSSLVHMARELTVTGESGPYFTDPNITAPLDGKVSYNKIFWIDSDIAWTPEDFFKLYDSDFEIVTGVYLTADEVTTTIDKWAGEGTLSKEDIIQMTEPEVVQSIGFGFVCVKNGVFESLSRPWFAHMVQRVQNKSGKILDVAFGEDTSWCIRAYQAGIKIYLDPLVKVDHMKTKRIGWQ